ncbi:capsule biosynthesis GfcC D2 domain-containing protein [Vibrio salinus]|uniref:capsule biosynthesis GfcC D2 domain-containing protein n=1 Tax=Vibrio salinus TaxID=2899784 RepID=UPI001E35E41F|nr:capsule biosynthesis GfcC D2 domain-containing protein [Vibrio salinus]MCE0493797.1 capsule biosynthesis GfcC family protein [Vibrio salinus]
MHYFFRTCALLSCLLYVPLIQATPTIINVQYGSFVPNYSTQFERQLRFKQVPRADKAVLTTLTALGLRQQNIDWLNSRIYDLSSPEQLKKRVMDILVDQYDLADNQTKYTLQGLMQFIKKSTFGHRILMPLDPDITRLNPRLNPRLKGKWRILLKSGKHTNSITIMGNVFNPGIYQWHNFKSARFYLNDTDNMDNVNTEVTVIQPDGKIETHLVKQEGILHFQDIAPGAILYVPFSFISSSLHPLNTMEDPNQLIIELLRNRIR